MVDCEGVSLASSCTKLPHSRSAEISKTPPPGAGPKGGGKMLAIRVHMLDDNITLFQVQAKAVGRVLFEQVCKQLHLLEADYFGLEYQDHSGIRYWLDLEKQLSRQVGLSLVEPLLHFCVKFYTPDPAQLEEEFTRYLFCLQVKRDLAQGHIQCNDNTAALMASYIVQAECGDYSADDYPDHTYLSSYKFVQHQDRELEKKIMDNHRKHIGQSPAEADLNLLETARRCELYGMKMHPAKDHEGVSLNLAVAHMGIAVFQNYAKIYTFSWAKVRKISFKRKRFLIKLHPDGYGYYKDVVEFFFESRNECKNLWKKCVENHGFFRCNAVKRVPRQRTRVLSRGSSFRYSGKTQKQMVEFVRENYVKRQNFQRSQSFRQSSSVHSSVATNVGGSISARPLIPLGDNSIVSVSCGSMVHVGAEEVSQSRTFQPMTATSQTTALRHTLPDQHSITAGLRSYNTASSQTDIVDLIETSSNAEQSAFNWQRSASAKELRKAPSDAPYEPPPRERNFIIAGSKTPSFDREAETKVYSSSYPGTTSSLSTESADELEPGGSVLVIDTGSSREFSHDDLSHDSYELIERDNFNYVHSRSCSIGSSGDNMLDDMHDDELFLMDDIRDDVDKRLGYVEPKYRDMAFNEFNEKCKQGIARFRERNQVEFGEYEAKCKPGSVIGYDESDVHYPVERTKSEPFVSDFWKIAKQHRKLFHQKSFDYTPTESLDSEDRSVTSKSTADIPYAVHKRQQMNGTAHCYECRSPVSPRKDDNDSVDFDRKGSIMIHDRLTKSKQDADLNSHDSGLSLSLVGESIDDLADKNNQFLKPNDQRYIKELKPSLKKEVFKFNSEDAGRSRNLLVKSKAQSADSGLRKGSSFDRNPPVEVIKIPSQDGEGIVICSTDDKNISLDTSDPDVIIVEYHSKRKRAFQKRSSSDGKGSFEKDKRMGSLDSAQPDSAKTRDRKFKEWRSESSSSCDNPASDFKRERFSKEVKTSIEGKVVRETREEKELKKQRSEELEKKKTEELRKQKSEELQRQKSEEYQKKIERRQEVIDALKKKHEDLNKIEIIKVGKEDKQEKKGFSRLAKPVVQKQDKVIELSPKPEHKEMEKVIIEVPVEINATKSQLRECNDDYYQWSPTDPEIKQEKESNSPVTTELTFVSSSLSFDRIKEAPEEEMEEEMKSIPQPVTKKPSLEGKLDFFEVIAKKEQDKMVDEAKYVTAKLGDVVTDSKLTSPELVWKKFGELPTISSKRERSPILFARLGFSEGSAFAPTNVQSPSTSRRAKSLDAPVVSLQRLPPITSFSSRDDTVDNEEDVELEEKTLRSIKTIHRENIIEEEDTSSLSPLVQDSNMFVKVIEAVSTQMLPDVVSGESHKDTVVCQPVATVVPSVMENYRVELPPCTKMYPVEIIFVDQDQKIPEVTLLSPSYKSKSHIANQLSDEQKVPESQCFETVDSGGPSEICDDEDSSFLNDVFEFSDSRKGSDVTEFSVSRDAQMSSTALDDPLDPTREPSPIAEVTERRPSTRQERLDSFKNTKSYSVDISTESEENEGRGIPTVDVEDWDQDDETFANDCMVPPMDDSSSESGSASLNDTTMNARNTNYNHVSPLATKLNGTILPDKSESYDDLKTNGNENLKPEILERETKKKRTTTLDKAYFIGKELLMTERTYKRDLELINLWAREAFSTVLDEPNYMGQLLNMIDPIDDFHTALLKDMEYHFSNLENRSSYDNRLSDLFQNIAQQREVYEIYIDSIKSVIHTLATDLAQGHIETVYTAFEKNKVCYLPLTLFILKPLQRLLHYSSLLDRVVDHYSSQNIDCPELENAKSELMKLDKKVRHALSESENYVQLIELSRDLACFEGKLIDDDRTFIRQGCLTKFSQKKGYQQRMFFLLSDMLLYCNLVGQKFKVHGQLPLRSLTLEEREDNPSPNSFTMYSEKRAITVCGSSQEEKNKWIKDISLAVDATKRDSSPSKTFFSLKCSSSADDVNEKDKNSNDATPQRSNTTVHVCWHRNTSVCLSDHVSAAQNQLSGYLLRKFKNSNGWQKLWVVFTNFCLFFYKTYQDEAPLASLPLLGYSVTVPSPTDGINKDFVFKLQFKNHVYFFRAESQYTFDRWMEVIDSATVHSQRCKNGNQTQEVTDNNNIGSP